MMRWVLRHFKAVRRNENRGSPFTPTMPSSNGGNAAIKTTLILAATDPIGIANAIRANREPSTRPSMKFLSRNIPLKILPPSMKFSGIV